MGQCATTKRKPMFVARQHNVVRCATTVDNTVDDVYCVDDCDDDMMCDYESNVILVSQRHFEVLYMLTCKLGSGAFGDVWLAVNCTSGEKVAIKALNKRENPQNVEFFRCESRIMLRLRRHPNVCTIQQIFETETFIYVVMEYCQSGDLFDFVEEYGTVTEREASFIIRDIASALAYAHTMGITHRDVKLENILCDTDGTFKLADFGLAKEFIVFDPQTGEETERMLKSASGSPMYISPEVVNHEPYCSSVDMWSLGVVLYHLLSGRNPFYAKNSTLSQVYRRIREGSYSFYGRHWKCISHGTKEFITQLLTVDANQRISAHQVLNHPWIQNEGKWLDRA